MNNQNLMPRTTETNFKAYGKDNQLMLKYFRKTELFKLSAWESGTKKLIIYTDYKIGIARTTIKIINKER